MTDDTRTVEGLTDEQIERVVRSTIFQKGLAYARLADGIEVLEEEDQIFESLVTTITKQHSQVRSEGSTREFFELFRTEVQTFTEPLLHEEETDPGELEDLYVDEEAEADG